MQDVVESEIKVILKTCGGVEGIDDVNEQRLREASWEYNDLSVEVSSEYRRINIRLLGGRWMENFA